jgi:hypothetical protein
LTGTLINNSLSDVFPHLRFLNISPQREWTEFSKTIVRHEKKHPKIVTKRIQVGLTTIQWMLGREQYDKEMN